MTSNVSSSSLAKSSTSAKSSSTSAKSSSSSANNVYNKNSNQTHRDSFSSIKSGSLSDGSSSSSSSSSTQNGSSSSMTSPSTAYTTSISSCNSIDKPYNNHYYIQPNDIASSTNLLNSTTHDSLSQSNNGNHYNSITSAQQLNSAQSFDFYSLNNKITTTTPLTTSKQFSSQINDDNSSVYSSTQNLGFSASRTPSPISSHLNHNLASFSSQISSQNSSSSRISTHQVNSGLLSSSPASSVNTSATSSTPTFSNTRVQSPISASSSSHVSTPSCESNRTASFNSRLNHLKNGNNSSSNSNVKSSAIPTPPPHPDTKETATIIQHYLRLISENSESRNPNDLYDIKKVIDEGSSAQVFTAHTLDTNEECAIKIVPLTYSLEFIFNEIFILKNLKHPHIVDFKESFVKWDGKTREVWLAMEKCARGDITSRAGRINQREVSRIARHLLLALKHLHQNNVIHRDIKLSNILCCANNDVKLADFGVSSLTSTSTTSMVGTIPYMAPDVVLVGPDRPYDTKVDIWSLGVCILELLTGKAAWGRIRDDVIMDKLRRGEAPYGFQRLSKKADIGWEVVDFLEKCFVKNPENRWDAEKLLEHPFITNSC